MGPQGWKPQKELGIKLLCGVLPLTVSRVPWEGELGHPSLTWGHSGHALALLRQHLETGVSTPSHPETRKCV